MESEQEFITSWYGRLCATACVLERKTPDILCIRCQRPKKDHHYSELKCDLYVTSPAYLAMNANEVKRTNEAIAAVEKLADVFGWKLAQ